MYLIDTNIFLEILLEQDKYEECEVLLNKIGQSKALFYVSSFTLHSIEVLMVRNNKIKELSEFISYVNSSKIVRLETNTADELQVLDIMKRLKLDFDDALQFYLCEKYKLNIISYDKHFDKTPLKRMEPKELLIES